MPNHNCRNFTTLLEFWNDSLGDRIPEGHIIKSLCKDAFTAGVFAGLYLRGKNIDPYPELEQMILDQSPIKGNG